MVQSCQKKDLINKAKEKYAKIQMIKQRLFWWVKWSLLRRVEM
jgi:hypothetical protein